jgi:hypothetical protein
MSFLPEVRDNAPLGVLLPCTPTAFLAFHPPVQDIAQPTYKAQMASCAISSSLAPFTDEALRSSNYPSLNQWRTLGRSNRSGRPRTPACTSMPPPPASTLLGRIPFFPLFLVSRGRSGSSGDGNPGGGCRLNEDQRGA